MKILLIDGYTPHPEAQGALTQALVATSRRVLQQHHQVQMSTSQDYAVAEEGQKWRWADLIILHFPVYWYAVPWGLKRYLDTVLARGTFYQTDDAGHARGAMGGKQFAYVATMAARHQDFAGGPSIDQLLLPLTVSLNFCGLVQAPQLDNYVYDDVYGPRPELARWATALRALA